MKKLFSFLLASCFVFALFAAAFAADVRSSEADELISNKIYRKYIQTTFDLRNVSKKNNVDLDDLTDAVIRGMKSDKFSPFSEIQTLDQKNAAAVESE